MLQEQERPSQRRGRTAGKPNPIDVHVGARVRLRRTLIGMSQEKLGAALGLTFQQVQKYERGANRIGASRLYDLSCILDVPVSFFFDDMPEEALRQSPRPVTEANAPAELGGNPLENDEALELVQAYDAIQNSRLRQRLMALVRTLSGV